MAGRGGRVPKASQKTGARAIAAALKQRRALELRLRGASFSTIAAEVGFAGKSSAYDAVRTALLETIQEPADEVRRIEVERLDRMTELLWAGLTQEAITLGARLFVVDRILALMDRRARLLGLDAPQKVDVEHRIRALAVEHGLDPDEAVAEARRVLKEARG